MAANSTIYCLEKLTDYLEFERLCHDLMLLEGYKNIEPLGGFKDKGRDAIYVSQASETTLFMYSVRKDWKDKLKEDVAKIIKHVHVCHKIVFITTSQPTTDERDKVIDHIYNLHGYILEIYGLERLRILLDVKYIDIKARYPQIFPRLSSEEVRNFSRVIDQSSMMQINGNGARGQQLKVQGGTAYIGENNFYGNSSKI